MSARQGILISHWLQWPLNAIYVTTVASADAAAEAAAAVYFFFLRVIVPNLQGGFLFFSVKIFEKKILTHTWLVYRAGNCRTSI